MELTSGGEQFPQKRPEDASAEWESRKWLFLAPSMERAAVLVHVGSGELKGPCDCMRHHGSLPLQEAGAPSVDRAVHRAWRADGTLWLHKTAWVPKPARGRSPLVHRVMQGA